MRRLEFCRVRSENSREATKGIPHRQIRSVVCCFLTLFSPGLAFSLQPSTSQMVRASISSTEADWKATPHFSYVERDLDEKDGVTTSKTYRVLMIEGSPYSRLIAVGGEPLSPAQQEREGKKLREEIAKRGSESPGARAKRVAKYQKDRSRMFALLHDMAEAFDFKRVGQQRMEGHEVYVLEATPRPGYEPESRETKLLTGMKGTLWIDKDTYQWVKVEAVAIKPVWMGWFIAKVRPGTRFSLEQAPVMKTFWLPKHFSVQVKAEILFWQKNYSHSETYSDYHLISRISAP
jgi:hypothetical protein